MKKLIVLALLSASIFILSGCDSTNEQGVSVSRGLFGDNGQICLSSQNS